MKTIDCIVLENMNLDNWVKTISFAFVAMFGPTFPEYKTKPPIKIPAQKIYMKNNLH